MDSQEKKAEMRKDERSTNMLVLTKGLALSVTISGYILVPLIVIGGIGYYLDNYFEANKIILGLSLIIAFGVSNLIVYKRAGTIAKKYKL